MVFFVLERFSKLLAGAEGSLGSMFLTPPCHCFARLVLVGFKDYKKVLKLLHLQIEEGFLGVK